MAPLYEGTNYTFADEKYKGVKMTQATAVLQPPPPSPFLHN